MTSPSAAGTGSTTDRAGVCKAMILDHTIVPAHDKDAAARFFAEVFGLAYAGAAGHFAPVQVNAGPGVRRRRPLRQPKDRRQR